MKMFEDRAAKFEKFKSQPFVQRVVQGCSSCGNSITPQEFLACFFGVDYSNEKDMRELMTEGRITQTMPALWFGGPPEYDEMCQSLRDLAHQAGRGELPNDPWFTTVEGRMAQMLLCDQVTRNAHRGTKEAFQYDELALKHAQVLASTYMEREKGDTVSIELEGTFLPPYLSFIILPYMHSEEPKDHEDIAALLEFCRQNDRIPPGMQEWWDILAKGELGHKRVIDRFGRYPHRNRAKGRETTPEEEAWLSDVENLPSWVKSQLSTNESE